MPSIIPYDSWIHSQLSIARHYGGIKIGDKQYIVDYIFCEEKYGLCKPDLVEEKIYMKMKKERKEEVRKYYNEMKMRQEEQQDVIKF